MRRKLISIVLSGLLGLSLIGCGNNEINKIDNTTDENTQTITEVSGGDLDKYFKAMNSTIDSYAKLANEFEKSYSSYSDSDFEDFQSRCDKSLKVIGDARGCLRTFNSKLDEYHGVIVDSMNGLKAAANNLISTSGGTEEQSMKSYNTSVDNMEDIIDKQDTLKKEILKSAQ